jgi:DNA helicase IV
MGEVVTVLEPPAAKGLEFDAVIVVEPAAFLEGGAIGGRLLYIALTRAVQELTIVHAAALPPALAP